MSVLSIQPTYPIFNETDGQPLEDGYIWIGQTNLDPQVNPINVYFDAALTIPAGQPIRTINGYPSRNGTPARLYVNSDYSIRVMNKNGSVVYSAPTATERYSDAVISGVNAEDVVYDPPFFGGVQTNAEAKLAQTVSVKDFGAVGDGVTDDTAAIQDAVDAVASGGVVTFPEGTYLIASAISVEHAARIDVSGATLTNSASNIFAFFITSSNVVIENGAFTGTQFGIAQIDALATVGVNTYTGIEVSNNTVNCTGNQSVVLTYAVTPDLVFSNNVCKATGASGSYPWASSGLRIINTTSGTSASGYTFTNNYFDGYRAPYNSEVDTPNYVGGGVLIEGNIILNSDRPISTYHHRNCKVVNNYINNYSTAAYAWQQSEWRGNTFKNYTGSEAAVKIEALLSVFAYNIVDTSSAAGILYDGEGQAGVISNNTIRNVTTYGIDFFPTFNYGGQPISVQIKDNVIYGCGSHGIYVHSGDSIRGLHLVGNRISGVGRTGSASDYSGIKVVTTAGRSFLVYIKNNTIFGNDNLYGIQDANLDYGIFIDDTAQAMAACLIADNDISITAPTVYALRAEAGTNIVSTGNRVTSEGSISNLPLGSNVVAGKQLYPQPIVEYGTDLNNFNTDGCFTTPNGGLSNLPSGWIQARYTVLVFGANNSNSGMQIIMGRNTDLNDIAVRTKYNGNWKTWRIL
jgi:hypothetical protein